MAPIDLLQVSVATNLQFVKKKKPTISAKDNKVKGNEVRRYACTAVAVSMQRLERPKISGFDPEACKWLISGLSPQLAFPSWYFIYLFLAALGLHCFARVFPAASGGYSLLWCVGFSLWWLLLQSSGLRARRLQYLWYMGFVVVALRHVESSWTRIRTCVPCIGSLILIHCCCYVTSVVSDSVRPHRWQPTRLPHSWDSPGKNTGVGCHFLLQCMKVKSESEVAQSCLTLSDPMECSLPGSSVHGIFQARVLEWGATPFSLIHCITREILVFVFKLKILLPTLRVEMN